MELEIGQHLASLLQTTPWFTLAALVLWPEKGVLALLIKRSQAVKVATIERDRMKSDIDKKLGQGPPQANLPPPVGPENTPPIPSASDGDDK